MLCIIDNCLLIIDPALTFGQALTINFKPLKKTLYSPLGVGGLRRLYTMIQRMQTIWLLLAAACAFATLKLAVYSGVSPDNTYIQMDGLYSIWTMILTSIIGSVAIFDIFLFKNRGTQMKFAFVGLLLSILNIVLYYYEIKAFYSGSLNFWSILGFAIPFLFIKAMTCIRRDQKLIKSLNRLR